MRPPWPWQQFGPYGDRMMVDFGASNRREAQRGLAVVNELADEIPLELILREVAGRAGRIVEDLLLKPEHGVFDMNQPIWLAVRGWHDYRLDARAVEVGVNYATIREPGATFRFGPAGELEAPRRELPPGL